MGILCCCCCCKNEVEPEDEELPNIEDVTKEEVQEQVKVVKQEKPKAKQQVTSRLKLIYFPLNASAEHVRLIFITAGVRYDDMALPDREWTELKPTVPLGDHPLLEVNGRIMTQPLAITRFVAAHCRLDAYTEHDRAFAESIVDSCLQVRQAGIAVAGLDVTDKAKIEFCKQLLVPRLRTFEQLLKKREYFVIGTMTYADIVVFSVIDQLRHVDATFDAIIKKFLPIVEFMKRMAKNANISKYLQDTKRYPVMRKYMRKVSVTSEFDVDNAGEAIRTAVDEDSDLYKRVVVDGPVEDGDDN